MLFEEKQSCLIAVAFAIVAVAVAVYGLTPAARDVPDGAWLLSSLGAWRYTSTMKGMKATNDCV